MKRFKEVAEDIVNKMDEAKAMGGKFIVRFKRGDQKPVQAIFDTKAQADAYEKEKKRMGFEIVEDAPANAVGTGANVALPPAVEPGVKKKEKDMKSIIIGALKRKLKENNDNNNIMLKQVLDSIDKVEVKIDAMNGITNTVDVEVEKTKPTFKEKYKI